MKRILVLEEKHGTRHFDASTDKLLAQAALSVLKARFDEGGWYYAPGVAPTKPDFAEADIEKMPASMQAAAKETFKQYRRSLNAWQQETDDYNRIKRAIDTNNGWLAWHILRDRSSYEYERAELETLEDASDVEVMWPPIPLGTRVVTTRSRTVRTETENQLFADLLGERKWGVPGEIVGFNEMIGLLYTIRFDDGTRGGYKPEEFKLLPKDKS